jgi:hypothetical protein
MYSGLGRALCATTSEANKYYPTETCGNRCMLETRPISMLSLLQLRIKSFVLECPGEIRFPQMIDPTDFDRFRFLA